MADLSNPSGLLAGKRGLIIGGTSGLGLASARQIVAWGGTVLPASSNPDKVAAALQSLAQPADLPTLTVDAHDKESVTGCVEQAVAALGRLDFLCYFAGLLRPGPIAALDEALLDEAFAVNTKGALWAAQAAFPTMRAQGQGVIVIIASMAAHGGWGGFPSYAISKHATLGLATNLANEWGQYGIRVIPVSPGVIITDLNRANMEKNVTRTRRFIEDTALGRLGEAPEIGSVVAFLCSDAASYMTGSPVIIDGGMLNRNAAPIQFDS